MNTIQYVKNLMLHKYWNTKDDAYKTLGYKVQLLIRLKFAWNSPDVSKYLIKKAKKEILVYEEDSIKF